MSSKDSERAAAAATHAQRGFEALHLGDIELAERSYGRAIDLAPEQARYYYGWAHLRTVRSDDRHIAGAERLRGCAQTLPIDERIALHFALGKIYGDLGRHEESFDQWIAGNALKRSTFDYDEAKMLGFFERVASVFTPEFVRARYGSGDPSPTPLFVIGMPRSGTTLVEQILASYSNVHPLGERSDVYETVQVLCAQRRIHYPEVFTDYSDFAAFGAAYLERAGTASYGAFRVMDKMPTNFLYAGVIALMLPNARVIHVRRDPVDTCTSCFVQLFDVHQAHMYDLAELGRYYRAYDRLMQHWRVALPEGVMLEVAYEDVVADIETQARRIAAHAGLEWDARCLDFHRTRRPVLTASAAQVRQPLYATAVGRGRKYGKRLAVLLEALT
jgi:tetratricopeptide (TPR) repeat protein